MQACRWLSVALVFFAVASTKAEENLPAPRCFRPLEDFEAKFLVSLVPGVLSDYKRGFTFKWDDTLSNRPGFDRQTYAVFEVRAETDTPSNLVGIFMVNKYTADVSVYLNDDSLEGPEMSAVQELIRKIHCIDADTIARYRRAPAYLE